MKRPEDMDREELLAYTLEMHESILLWPELLANFAQTIELVSGQLRAMIETLDTLSVGARAVETGGFEIPDDWKTE